MLPLKSYCCNCEKVFILYNVLFYNVFFLKKKFKDAICKNWLPVEVILHAPNQLGGSISPESLGVCYVTLHYHRINHALSN